MAIVVKMVRCGKPGCRCARGKRHGPYRYRVARKAGKVVSNYEGPVSDDRLLARRLAAWGREQAAAPPPPLNAEDSIRAMDEALMVFGARGPSTFETFEKVRAALARDAEAA